MQRIPFVSPCKNTKIDLSIVIPCFNEEATIETCVIHAYDILNHMQVRGEVLVVDNGSTDNSAQIAEHAGAVVLSEPIRGYGMAASRGLAEATGDVIVLINADNTYDFEDIPAIASPLLKKLADLTIGDRFCGRMEKDAMSFFRQIRIRLLSAIRRFLYHSNVADFQCGIRGIRREALKQLTFQSEGSYFSTEMIVLAEKNLLRIIQIPVSFKARSHKRATKK